MYTHLLRAALCAALLAIGLPHPAHAQLEAEGPTEAYAEAIAYYNNRLYDQAVGAFSTYRRTYPEEANAAEALYFEAKSLLALGHDTEALQRFRQLRAEYPTHPKAEEAQLSLGTYYYGQGNAERGREVLQQIATQSPNSPLAPRALFQLGTLERERGNLQSSLQYFQQVSRQHPDADVAPAALYATGATYVRLESYDEAARAFEALGQRYASSPYARNLGIALAEVYYELGDYRSVIGELENRVQRLEGDAQDRATFLLAESYNQLDDSENAIVYYRRFTEQNPDSPYYRPALYGLGWNYFEQDTYQWAAENFEQVRTTGTDALAEKATYYEAVSRSLTGQPDQALALYQELLQNYPDSELADQAQYEIGMLHYQGRRWSAANQSFTRLLRNHPNSPRTGEALYMQGNTFIALNRFDQALSSFNQAIEQGAAPDSLRDEMVFQKAWINYVDESYGESASAFLDIYESAPNSSRSEDALFWGAESLYQSGRMDRAQDLFNRYLREYPQGEHVAATHYALGWTHFRRQQYSEAANAFQRFLRAYNEDDGEVPYRQDALLRLGDSYYAMKQYRQAIDTYRRVEGTGDDYALYQTGQALNLNNQPEAAVRAFRDLVQEYPESNWREEALYRIGAINFEEQDYEAAIAAYQRVIDTYPEDDIAAKAQYGIGDAYFNAGQLDQSVTAYRRVLERYPNSPFASDAASSLQYALIAMGDEDRASTIIDSIASANPNSSMVDELRFRQAEATYQSGRVDRAANEFRRFIRSSSNEQLLPEAYYYLGIISADRNQYGEAENYLRQVVDNYASSERAPEAALRLGEVYEQQDQYERALQTYRRIARMDQAPEDIQARARYGQSMALLELGRNDEAERMLQRVIETTPNGSSALSARLGLGRIYAEQGQIQQATGLFRTVVENAQNETGAEALYRLGALLLEQGRPRPAIEELSRMPALYAGYPEWVARSYLEQARAYRQLDQSGEASRLYDQVINEYAGTEYAQIAAREKQAL